MKKTLLAACVLMSAAATAQTIALPDNATATFAPGTVVLVNTFDKAGKPVQQVVEIPETQEMKDAKQKLFRAGEATVKLTVNIEPDENGENDVPFVVSLMKDAQAGWNSFKTNSEFNVPAGQYVLQVAFKNNSQLFYDIDLTEDKTMTVNADMATNRATVQSMLPNGDALVMPTYLDGMLQDNPYNSSYLYAGAYFHYKGLSRAGYSINIGRGGPEYYQTKLPQASNITTADGMFIWNILCVTTDSDVMGISVFNPADEVPADGIIRNKVEDYVKVEGKFENTPAWTSSESSMKCRFNSYRAANVGLDELTYTTDGMTAYYLCAPIFALDHYNATMSLEKIQTGGDNPTGIITPSMARGEEGLKCYDTQVNNPYSDTTTISSMLQVAPEFSYNAVAANPVFGSSTPICVTGFTSVRDNNWQYHPVFGINGYYGNSGESFTVDRALSKIRVNMNGSENNFTDYASYQQWYLTNINNIKGNLSYSFINDNVRIDGIKGSTECQIAYNGDDLENLTLPTVQRMMFNDANGLPANKFKDAENNTLLIAAGNYKFVTETKQMGAFRPTFNYFILSHANVRVEVSPNGTDEFSELPIAESNKLPDPSYGYLWGGNLSDVKAQSANGWFDVRITVTNDEGTAQTQTVSPAFYVESLKGVGVDGIEMESKGEARYFNLQGIGIEKPAEGICIRRVNGKAEKIAIK